MFGSVCRFSHSNFSLAASSAASSKYAARLSATRWQRWTNSFGLIRSSSANVCIAIPSSDNRNLNSANPSETARTAGVRGVISKSGANVEANEAVRHVRWNVEEATAGLFGEAHEDGEQS